MKGISLLLIASVLLILVACGAAPMVEEDEQGSSESACTAVPRGEVTVYQRPDTAADIFAPSLPSEGVTILARTLDGWLGFDPGVAQAANVGPFRLRWIKNDSNLSLSESCAARPVAVVVGPPAGVCFTMAMSTQDVYASADQASQVVATMNAEDYAAVIGRSEDGNWAQLALAVGSLGGSGTGWLPAAALNLNGPCE